MSSEVLPRASVATVPGDRPAASTIVGKRDWRRPVARVALYLILRTTSDAFSWSLFDGGYTFASLIASAASEFSQPLPTGAYIAAGLVLFVITLAVNMVARWIVSRHKEFSGAN